MKLKKIVTRVEELALLHDQVSPDLIREKNIKLGLRNPDGTGVIVGITSKGKVIGYEQKQDADGNKKTIPTHGKLFYCNYDVEDLVNGISAEKRFGFDEIVYLLLTGELPGIADLTSFTEVLAERRSLEKRVKSIILEEGLNDNQMYALHAVVSYLSRLDPHADSTDFKDVTEQSISLIAKFPTIVAYNCNVLRYGKGGDLLLVKPDPDLSTAENFLYMLRGERPTEFEARLFDMAMMLHVEHGGGNNSTFTVRTVTSAGTGTYMAICAGIASLSGYLHGGANEAVMRMMKDIKNNVRDWNDDGEIRTYLKKILDKKAFDGSGKIYGMGHAVYTLSDPRAVILREKAREFAAMKGATEEFALFEKVADISMDIFTRERGKNISPNVDFFSGFIYKHMGIPREIYTPIFAMARVVGWAAHRIEQIVQAKLIRPAYLSSLTGVSSYVPMSKRK